MIPTVACSAAQNAIPIIESSIGKPRGILTAEKKAKLDLFMSLYGRFDGSALDEVYNAKNKLDNVKSFLNKYAGGLSTNGFRIDFFCDDSKWEFVKYKDGEYSSSEATFLHELSHATAFFGKDGILEDVEDDDGEETYQFDPCYELAQSDRKITDIAKIRPLKNADTFVYFCAGLYLSQCNWRDGLCQNPANVK
ncbi:hypothetical protein CNMCM6106_003279 [Aspergillus hiratsukae]|uniref:Lysine-specific metallo-endopeptidase domain-containing protein n=1 Tax=Aspergillus hiratsukae TaxID=1194566 RepID=A0A8H6UXK6_9EURO|nr:hypothetical protein CNMCM6106_003279 [Aspergillus hiratsukae]